MWVLYVIIFGLFVALGSPPGKPFLSHRYSPGEISSMSRSRLIFTYIWVAPIYALFTVAAFALMFLLLLPVALGVGAAFPQIFF